MSVTNSGKTWRNEEEILLLKELNNNIDINLIAQNHNRTANAITLHIREIAYKMHLDDIPIKVIIEKTKLCKEQIINIKKKKQSDSANKVTQKHTENEIILIKSQIADMKRNMNDMKRDINDMKNTMKEFSDIIKIVYTSASV